MKQVAPSFEDMVQALDRIAGMIPLTPCAPSPRLSALTGCQLVLKYESLQHSGAPLERGMLNKLLSLSPEQRAAGVICGGNFADVYALAVHAERLDIGATLVLPMAMPASRIARLRAAHAHILLVGEDREGARREAAAEARRCGGILIPARGDGDIISGQATLGIEILDAVPDADMLLVPADQDDLIEGLDRVARYLGSKVEIVAIEMRPPPIFSRNIALDDAAIERATALLLSVEKAVVDPAGAACLGALLARPDRFAGRKVVAILSAADLDLPLLARAAMSEYARCDALWAHGRAPGLQPVRRRKRRGQSRRSQLARA